MRHHDRVPKPKQGVKMGMALNFDEPRILTAKGTYILDLRDNATGQQLDYRELSNIITLDSGILTAMYWGAGPNPSPALSGLTMLAVGTGATGALLNPDVPDPRQRQLNAEVSLGRKAFQSRVSRTSAGAVSSVYTNILDLTTSFGEGEGVGPLNEMGLVRTISQNPAVRTSISPAVTFPAYDTTVDMTLFDLLANYTTFSVISKPSNSTLNITWRLSF